MKIKTLVFLILIGFTGVCLTGCSKKKAVKALNTLSSIIDDEDDEDKQEDKNKDGAADEIKEDNKYQENSSTKPTIGPEYFKGKVEEWNNSLNMRDEYTWRRIFAPTVFFYTKQLSIDEVVKQKNKALDAEPSWRQEIISDVIAVKNDDGTVDTYFTKQSHSDKGVHTYEAYLVWREIDGQWKIIRESDPITDHNVAKRRAKESKW